jgi:hypothetical protein
MGTGGVELFTGLMASGFGEHVSSMGAARILAS